MKKKIKILALSWRDIEAPDAGGAEVHTHKMLSGMDHARYEIVHFSPRYEGAAKKTIIDGVVYLRHGNIYSVLWYAFLFYRRHAKEFDYVIDQCNTHRFFTWLYVPCRKRIFYIHQLTREIWKYSMRWPFYLLGQFLETWMLKRNRKDKVITVSESTKQELIALGYKPENIAIVYNGISFEPWTEQQMYDKEKVPTFIYAGRYAPYKGIDVALEAFGQLKQRFPQARLWIIGRKNENYVEQRLLPICRIYGINWSDGEDATGDVISWGYVSEDKKLELFSRATALLFPSVREGWGIPITEAGVVGTPSIVFDSAGIRDAVDRGNAGYICGKNNVGGLRTEMEKVIEYDDLYQEKKKAAYEYSKQFQWGNLNRYLEGFFDM